MIKIIQKGTPPTPTPNFHYRITCSQCKTRFDCDAKDCYKKNVAQGFIAHAINCPVCGYVCYDWQGGCDEWSVTRD